MHALTNKQGKRDLEREMDVNCCEKANSYHVKEDQEEEEEDIETLKKRIKGHALFRLLIERHLDCLKVSLGDNEEVDIASPASCEAGTECNGHASFLSSDLDKFMEVQCMALGKLKEAMEIPFQETVSFINAMYQQLN